MEANLVKKCGIFPFFAVENARVRGRFFKKKNSGCCVEPIRWAVI